MLMRNKSRFLAIALCASVMTGIYAVPAWAATEGDTTDVVTAEQLNAVKEDVNTLQTDVTALQTDVTTLQTSTTTLQTDVTTLQTDVTALQTSTTTLQTNITTLQGYFTNGKANEAIKASQDSDGNVIKDTYATKTQLTTDLKNAISGNAFGSNVNVYGSGSYAMGKNITVGQNGDSSVGQGTYVIGKNINTEADHAIIMGVGYASSDGSLPADAPVYADNTVNIGYHAAGTANSAVAIGYDATKKIRSFKDEKKANIPIIAMTADAFEENRQHALEIGMNGFITKPIDIQVLLQTIDEIINK